MNNLKSITYNHYTKLMSRKEAEEFWWSKKEAEEFENEEERKDEEEWFKGWWYATLVFTRKDNKRKDVFIFSDSNWVHLKMSH